MKISADWLSDYVDLSGVASDELAEKLTVRTSEVEGVEVVRRDFARVCVVDIVTATPFEVAGGTRHAVVVTDGTRTWRTVCGAPNVRVGMKAVFAHAGAKLADGSVVQSATLHGHPSEGILCAAGEIGIGTAKDALLEVPANVATGTPLAQLVPEHDAIIEIDNKSLTHRPDLWGHHGFARELAAIFGRALRPLAVADLAAFDALPAFPVTVDDTDGCPLYSALGLEVSDNPVSPLRVQARLLTLGNAPINALVDVTNYAQLELGQPTHAFDAACMHHARVAAAGERKSFTTLDGKTWALSPRDLLILDGDEPVALAGIMGGLSSRVLPETRKIVLESANFRASRVRVTSVRLALRTESSLRFEKKLPPVYARMATGRIVRLLEDAGLSPRGTSRYSHVGDFRDAPRTITLAPGWLSRRAGTEIPNATAAKLLGGIGLTTTAHPDGGLSVEVPAFRGATDLAIPEDISEEVARLFGYENIPPTPPLGPLHPRAPHLPTRNHHRMRRVLSQGHGFVEVQTYAWFADEWTETVGYAPASPLRVRNPSGATRANMRDSLVPNLLAIAHQNRRLEDAFRVFELGRVFWMDGAEKREEDHLAGVAVDQAGGSAEALFRSVRGALEDLAEAAGLPALGFEPVTGSHRQPWIRAGRTLGITLRGETVGHMGLLGADTTAKVLDAGHAVWFALRTEPLRTELFPSTRYVAPAPFPGSWQDFTFAWPVAKGYGELVSLLDTFAHPTLEGRAFVTSYQPKGAEEGKYSFRFSLRVPDRTIATADIDAFRDTFLAFAKGVGLVIA